MLPEYVNEYLQAYFQVSSEDRRKLLDMRYFDTDPLTCQVAYLPYLAIEAGVTLDGLSEKEARQSIANAIATLNQKGTLNSLKSALAPFGSNALKEWFDTGKEPYIFDIDLSLSDRQITPELVAKLKQLIEFTKNVRSRLDELILAYRTQTSVSLHVGAMGESCGDAQMIDGFTSSAFGIGIASVGAMGETTAIAVMEA